MLISISTHIFMVRIEFIRFDENVKSHKFDGMCTLEESAWWSSSNPIAFMWGLNKYMSMPDNCQVMNSKKKKWRYRFFSVELNKKKRKKKHKNSHSGTQMTNDRQWKYKRSIYLINSLNALHCCAYVLFQTKKKSPASFVCFFVFPYCVFFTLTNILLFFSFEYIFLVCHAQLNSL